MAVSSLSEFDCFYQKGFIKKFTHDVSGLNLYVKPNMKYIGKEKRGAYGTYSGATAANSLSTFSTDNQVTTYLALDENLLYEKGEEFYLCDTLNNLFPAKKSGWIPTSSTCSSITREGISEVWETINKYVGQTQSNNYFYNKRKDQNQYWMLETINEQLKTNFFNHPEIEKLLEVNKKAVQNDEISPFAAAQLLLKKYFK